MNYSVYLTENVLKFWLENAIDQKYGGIYTCLDEQGDLYGREKSVWFQGRALWIFSKVYNAIDKAPKYLEAARKIYDFLPKCTDSDGRMFFLVTEDGRPIQKRRYYFSETFAAIGCAEFYKATGESRAWELAEQYFETAYKIYKNPTLTVPKFYPENAPYKALSPAMILLSTAQCMRSVGGEKYNRIAKEMTDEIITGGFLRENALLETVSVDGEYVNTPTGRVVNPGHSLEAAWFLMSEGVYQHDRELIEKAMRVVDFSMERGLDNGGILAFTDAEGRPPMALEWDMKLWWPQCEAIIANKMAHILSGNQKYLEQFNSLLTFAMEHFADAENGEWFGYLHYDGTIANRAKGNIFKGPFHLPRMLIWLILAENGHVILD